MCSVEGPPLREKRARPMTDDLPMPIYLDHNATTPVSDAAWDAMMQCRELMIWGNPSSTHDFGLHSKYYVDQARSVCAAAVGAEFADQIVFTSGGTESNNIAIIGTVLDQLRNRGKDVILTTMFEHPAVSEVLSHLRENHKCSIVHCPVNPDTGVLDIGAFDELLRKHYQQLALVTIMHANNEIGAIQPLEEVGARIAEAAKEFDTTRVPFHIDASQSLGKIPVNVRDLGCDYLTICSHKFYGPKGVGALYRRSKDLALAPVILGAAQEAGQRAGTENLILTRGMAAALKEAVDHLEANVASFKDCRDLLFQRLNELGGRHGFEVRVNGSLAHCLPNTLNVSLFHKPNEMYISGHRMIQYLGSRVAMSAGAACHSVNGEDVVTAVSSSLQAVRVDEERARGTLRLSTGHMVKTPDIERAARLIIRTAVAQMPETT